MAYPGKIMIRKYILKTLWLLIFCASCESELIIMTPDFQPTPVIYGLLDPFDSIQCIRVQRSFQILDKEGAMLNDSDSLYFKNVDVWVRGLTNNEMVWEYNLVKTDAIKDSGRFTGNKHHVYQILDTFPISIIGASMRQAGIPDVEKLRLDIDILELDVHLSAESPIFSPVVIIGSPSSRTASVYGSSATMFTYFTQSLDKTAKCNYGEIEFTVHFVETTDNGSYDRDISWHTTNGFSGGYILTPENFFNRILRELSGADSANVRVFRDFDIKTTLAQQDFGDYHSNISPWEGIIEYPISGIENAYGYFFTKTTGTLMSIGLDRKSLDSLCNSPNWSHLKFKHW